MLDLSTWMMDHYELSQQFTKQDAGLSLSYEGIGPVPLEGGIFTSIFVHIGQGGISRIKE